METLFTYLFKYRPFVFGEGKLGFAPPTNPWILFAGVVLVASLLIWLSGRMLTRYPQGRILFAIRLSVCLLLLLLLMRPTLTLARMTPQTGILAFLIDNSRSMSLGTEGSPRSEGVAALADPEGRLASDLSNDFQLRWLRFDRATRRLENPQELNWSGDQTNLAGALRELLNETRNLPLAGVVLVSDGADNSFRDLQSVVGEYCRAQDSHSHRGCRTDQAAARPGTGGGEPTQANPPRVGRARSSHHPAPRIRGC